MSAVCTYTVNVINTVFDGSFYEQDSNDDWVVVNPSRVPSLRPGVVSYQFNSIQKIFINR